MPKDKNGQQLQVGDEVLLRARVKFLSATENFSNVTIETIEPMYPGAHSVVLHLNTKQVEKVEGSDGALP